MYNDLRVFGLRTKADIARDAGSWQRGGRSNFPRSFKSGRLMSEIFDLQLEGVDRLQEPCVTAADGMVDGPRVAG